MSTRAIPSHSIAANARDARAPGPARAARREIRAGTTSSISPSLVLGLVVVPLVVRRRRSRPGARRAGSRLPSTPTSTSIPSTNSSTSTFSSWRNASVDRRLELAVVVRLRDPDRGAEPRRLDEDRVAERVRGRVAGAQRDVAGDRDAVVAQHRLEEVLVHRERRGGDAGADVGDAGELEQPLHRPVLAERPVQHAGRRRRRRPSAVGDRAGPGSAHARARPRPARSAPRRRAPSGPSRSISIVDDLAPARREGRGDAPGRGERDVVLARAAAGEDATRRLKESRAPVARAGAGGCVVEVVVVVVAVVVVVPVVVVAVVVGRGRPPSSVGRRRSPVVVAVVVVVVVVGRRRWSSAPVVVAGGRRGRRRSAP